MPFLSLFQSKKVLFSAVPSAFFFFYWAVCISAIATSLDIFSDLIVHNIPEVTVCDVADYRDKFMDKRPRFTDQDVANLLNDVNFFQQWNHQSVQGRHIILCFFAVTGLAILIITTLSGHEILRLLYKEYEIYY
jgi:hypothetical protein